MKISHHEFTDSGRLRQVDAEEFLRGWQSGTGQYWIDVEQYEFEELVLLLDRLGVSPFLKRHCLDVLSAVFLPLTLMAGIWGMNFERMFLTQVAHGFPIALGSMAGIAAVLTWYFYKRGWFR